MNMPHTIVCRGIERPFLCWGESGTPGDGQFLRRASDPSLSADDVARLEPAPRYVPQPPVCQSFCPLSVGLAPPRQFFVSGVTAWKRLIARKGKS